jgi:hypothetical protein
MHQAGHRPADNIGHALLLSSRAPPGHTQVTPSPVLSQTRLDERKTP